MRSARSSGFLRPANTILVPDNGIRNFWLHGLSKPHALEIRTGNILLRVQQIVIKRGLAPSDGGCFVGSGVREAFCGARGSAEKAAQVGPLWMLSELHRNLSPH